MTPIFDPMALYPPLSLFNQLNRAPIGPGVNLSRDERAQKPFVVVFARFATHAGATTGSDLDAKTTPRPSSFEP